MGVDLNDPRLTGAFELDPAALNLPAGKFDLTNFIVSTKSLGKGDVLNLATEDADSTKEGGDAPESTQASPSEAPESDAENTEEEGEEAEASIMMTAVMAVAGGAIFAVALFFLMGML